MGRLEFDGVRSKRPSPVLLVVLVASCVLALVQVGVSFAGPQLLAAPPTRYSVTCTALTNTALSTTSEVVFAAAATRKKMCVSNFDASIAIYIAFHTTATSADVRLAAGQTLCEAVEDGYIYTGVVHGLAASGTPAIGGWDCI